jgi:hypothetical protein
VQEGADTTDAAAVENGAGKIEIRTCSARCSYRTLFLIADKLSPGIKKEAASRYEAASFNNVYLQLILIDNKNERAELFFVHDPLDLGYGRKLFVAVHIKYFVCLAKISGSLETN